MILDKKEKSDWLTQRREGAKEEREPRRHGAHGGNAEENARREANQEANVLRLKTLPRQELHERPDG